MTSALITWGLILGIIGLGWMIFVALTANRPQDGRSPADLEHPHDDERVPDEFLSERRRAG